MALAATRRPTTSRHVHPTATPKHSIRTVDSGVEVVPAPFPHVAHRVVEAPGIRLFGRHRVNALIRVVAVPSDVTELAVPNGRRARPARIFPLGLARQTITVRCPVAAYVDGIGCVQPRVARSQALALGQSIAKLNRIDPRNIPNRSPRIVAWVRVARDDAVPQLDCHRHRGDLERREFDLPRAPRAFITNDNRPGADAHEGG